VSVHIGTSGWSYDHWNGVLYPDGLAARERLSVYASRFQTVELNASFYRWPPDRTFAGWRRRLPEGFVMSVKAARGLTHAKRLAAPKCGLAGSPPGGMSSVTVAACCRCSWLPTISATTDDSTTSWDLCPRGCG